MKSFKFLIIFILGICFASCSDDDAQDPDVPATRTMLVYCCADNNLGTRGYLEKDLREIETGAKNLAENENLVVFVDLRNEAYIAKIDSKGSRIVRRFDRGIEATSQEGMHEIVSWVFSKYPALSYAITFWGHGTGWLKENETSITKSFASVGNFVESPKSQAYGSEVKNGTSVWMNLSQMKSALEGLPCLDYVYFDCCHMQSIEVAYELRNVCHYILGCPAETPGNGAPYDKIVKDMFKEDAELATKNILKIVENEYDGLPMSVLDTRKIDDFMIATGKVLQKRFDSDTAWEKVDMTGVPYYGALPDLTANYPVFYDLRAFMCKYLDAASLAAWEKALDDFVIAKTQYVGVAKWHTLENIFFDDFTLTKDNFCGFSFFIPRKEYELIDNKYPNPNEAIKETEYYKYLFK